MDTRTVTADGRIRCTGCNRLVGWTTTDKLGRCLNCVKAIEERQQRMKRRCRTCKFCDTEKKECHEGGFTEIGDLDRELSEEDCGAWQPRDVEVTTEHGIRLTDKGITRF